MIGADVQRVKDELTLWRAIGEMPVFWIRDDDATCVSGQLERLHSIATRYDVNVGLALIPGLLEADLVAFLRTKSSNFYPMCHGWKHVNHASAGNPGRFGNGRSHRAACLDATRAGYAAIRQSFYGHSAVFVPPFKSHRVDHDRCAGQHRLFSGLSVGPRPLERRIARVVNRYGWAPALNIAWKGPLQRIDAHVDQIEWKSGSARDMDVVADALMGQLRLRRKGFLPPRTPIGLLTHHRVHDERIWHLLESLIVLIKSSLECEFMEVGHMFRQSCRGKGVRSAPGGVAGVRSAKLQRNRSKPTTGAGQRRSGHRGECSRGCGALRWRSDRCRRRLDRSQVEIAARYPVTVVELAHAGKRCCGDWAATRVPTQLRRLCVHPRRRHGGSMRHSFRRLSPAWKVTPAWPAWVARCVRRAPTTPSFAAASIG